MAKKINVAELDFDQIKANIKTFLQGQEQFQDYDFEGSGLAILLDVLAYNTHYNALYTNLAINETFIDSASKRSSVVSRAKELGYIPYSATGAQATVDITVSATSSTPAILSIPAFSPFTGTADGQQYTFYNLETVTATLNNNVYTFNDVIIKEGTPLTYRYVANEGTRYIIPNEAADLSTLSVRIQSSATSTFFETYSRQEDILNLDGNSKVYFVKEIDGELYELEFGNGVIGKALENGNVINMTYMTSNKNLANGIRLFSYSGSSLLGGVVTVTTTTPAFGGGDIEPIDNIRYNAPRSYTAQNRAVTVEDYKALLYKLYPEAQTINVWGGENNVPKQYGKVFISIKPKTSNQLTDVQKSYIINEILRKKNVVSITPEIVDPVFINLEVNATVYYNPNLTTKTASEIKDLVIQTIQDYNTNQLNSFSGVFKFSKLTSAIDATEDSITSNITTIKLHREVQPIYNTKTTYQIELGNPIYGSGVPEQSILSTGFYLYGREEVMYLEDLPLDPEDHTYGLLRIYYFDEAGQKIYFRTLGSADNPTVNYKTGSITIPEILITGLDFSQTDVGEIIIKPQSNDVVSVRNQLVTIPDNKIIVNVIPDTVSAGDSSGGSNYIFTSSRS